jgi:hypothetical protein
VAVEELRTGKKLTDRRMAQSAPPCASRQSQRGKKRNENKKKKERKTRLKIMGLATKPMQKVAGSIFDDMIFF